MPITCAQCRTFLESETFRATGNYIACERVHEMLEEKVKLLRRMAIILEYACRGMEFCGNHLYSLEGCKKILAEYHKGKNK